MRVLKGNGFMIYESKGQYTISWYRGQTHYSYPMDEKLVNRALATEEEGKKVMFYLEKGHWPESRELEHYNETNIITHKGNGFLVYEEDGRYEMRWLTGGFQEREEVHSITKDLMDRAFQSDQDAYDVKIYLTTGLWPNHNQDDIDRQFIRQYPEVLLKNPETSRSLFSDDEFEKLLKKAQENSRQEK